MVTRIQTAIVYITTVHETRTRGTWQAPDGVRRWVIGAEQTTVESLGERLISLSTLDPWKATLATQAMQKGLRLKVRYKTTRFFDLALLSIELVKESAA